MTKHEELAVERLSDIYSYLEDKGVVEAESDAIDYQTVVDGALDDYASKLEAYHANKTRSTITLDMSRLAFLRLYREGEDEEGLHGFIAEQKWTSKRDMDNFAFSVLGRYIKIRRELEQRGKIEAQEHADALELALRPEDYRDLEETILVKKEQGAMMPAFAGQLLLVLDKRVASGRDPNAIMVAKQQATALLRIRMSRFELSEDMHPRAAKGIEYLQQIVGHSYQTIKSLDSIVFEPEKKISSKQEDFAERKRKIETYIAYAIEELFP